jgi:hypothetical protein
MCLDLLRQTPYSYSGEANERLSGLFPEGKPHQISTSDSPANYITESDIIRRGWKTAAYANQQAEYDEG